MVSAGAVTWKPLPIPDMDTPLSVDPLAVGAPSLQTNVRASSKYVLTLPAPMGVRSPIWPPVAFRTYPGHCTQSRAPAFVKLTLPEVDTQLPLNVGEPELIGGVETVT